MNVVLRNGIAPANLGRVDWILDIQRAISARSLEAGALYAAQNCVSGIAYGTDGSTIQARTRGSRPRPYEQHIRLTRRRDGGFDIVGRCSCPVGLNCKHVAAVLLVADPAKAGEPNEDARNRLPDHFSAWLRGVEQDAEADSEAYPASVTDRLVFVVAEAASNPSVMRIDPVAVRLKKSGGLAGSGRIRWNVCWKPARRSSFVRPIGLCCGFSPREQRIMS